MDMEDEFMKSYLGWIGVLVFGMGGLGEAQACDVTVSAGGDVRSAVTANAGKKVCLQPGVYSLGGTTLDVPTGTWLEGVGADRDGIVLASSATRALRIHDNVVLKNFALWGPGGDASEFGILSHHNRNQILWGLRISNFLISIGVNGSADVDIWDTFMAENGSRWNGLADPNIWISDARNVTILYGEARGRGNGPSGDGEIAAYNSTGVTIEGTHVNDSGASAIYLVNCDYCRVSNTVIHRPGEWGIDVVDGSDHFVATGNVVKWAGYGGSVFDEAGSVGGVFRNNEFHSNRQRGVGACNGINVIGQVAGVEQSGNYSNRDSVICRFR